MASEIPPKTQPETKTIPYQEQGLDRLSEEEAKLHRFLVPHFKKSAISLASFEGLYDKDMIASDQAYVARREAGFQREIDPETAANLRRAELLEALLREQIKYNNWLGREATPITTSRYDDILNGVDMIVELLREEGVKRLALSVDVTSNSVSLEKKLQRIKEDISKGELTSVKYFISSDGNRQEIRNVPRVVIGTDSKTIKGLSFTRLEFHNLSKSLDKNRSTGFSEETIASIETRKRGARLKLAKHRVQILILDEIELQINAFIRFAEKVGQLELAQEYARTLEIVRAIRKAKTVPGDQRSVELSTDQKDENANDGVFRALQIGLKIFE